MSVSKYPVIAGVRNICKSPICGLNIYFSFSFLFSFVYQLTVTYHLIFIVQRHIHTIVISFFFFVIHLLTTQVKLGSLCYSFTFKHTICNNSHTIEARLRKNRKSFVFLLFVCLFQSHLSL